MEWRHFEFLVSDIKQIKVRNCENDAKEELDLKDRVIKMSAGFGYLIVITPSQCYIYRYIFCSLNVHSNLFVYSNLILNFFLALKILIRQQ